MGLELARFVSDESDCEYLPERRAAMEYRLLVGLGPDELDQLLERGWRRFGAAVFRPVCVGCGECVSLRIDVASFRPSRSQRRARNRCAHLRVEIGPPGSDEEKLALYARWHAAREQTRGWEASPLEGEEYERSFAAVDSCAREVRYRDGDRLVGVGICDQTESAWNAVYFFHEPELARLSLGVNHVLTLVDLAREQGKRHVYLGYRVMGCFSMRYKAAFRPHQVLEGRPAAKALPLWREETGAPPGAPEEPPDPSHP